MIEYIFAVLEWCKVTIFIRGKKKKVFFKEGEIWWCSIGMNIGAEVFGKGPKFERPVLILKKFDSNFFFGIPITSQIKRGSWYTPLHFEEKETTAILSQARTLHAKRLSERMGTLTQEQFESIKKKFLTFHSLPKSTIPAKETGIDSSPATEPENSG